MPSQSTGMRDGTEVADRTDVIDTARPDERAARLTVDRHRSEPLPDQIARQVRSRVADGTWPPHYRLPSEPALARQLGVNRGTVRKALATLVDERLLVTVRGRGTFVASQVVEPLLEGRLRSLSEDFAAQGVASTTRVLSASVGRLPLPVQALLDVPAGTPGLRLERVFVGAEGPLAYLVNYVRADLCPGIERTDFTTRALFDVIEHDHGLRIVDGRRTFGADAARADVATNLGVPSGSPVLYLEQITYLADGRPVEYSDIWVSTSRIKVTTVLRR
jgi:DNA-binding GntR family transcriptional regulator